MVVCCEGLLKRIPAPHHWVADQGSLSKSFHWSKGWQCSSRLPRWEHPKIWLAWFFGGGAGLQNNTCSGRSEVPKRASSKTGDFGKRTRKDDQRRASPCWYQQLGIYLDFTTPTWRFPRSSESFWALIRHYLRLRWSPRPASDLRKRKGICARHVTYYLLS